MMKLQEKWQGMIAAVVTLLLTSQMTLAAPSPDESKEIEKPSAQDLPPPEAPTKKTIPGPPEPKPEPDLPVVPAPEPAKEPVPDSPSLPVPPPTPTPPAPSSAPGLPLVGGE